MDEHRPLKPGNGDRYLTGGLNVKQCGKCKKKKPYSSFHKRGSGYQPWCKSCKKESDSSYYRENRKRWDSYKTKWRKSFVEWYRSLKNKPCADCNQVFDPVCMDWDYLPQYKKGKAVSTIAQETWNKEKVLEEIKKCELVCSNCHRIRTQKRSQNPNLILEVK